MKIFNWIHGKIHGKQSINKPHSNTSASTSHVHEKEEFSDWPNGLLAIGTFGNNNQLKDPQKSNNSHQENPVCEKSNDNSNNVQENPTSCDDQRDQEFSIEEALELRKELKLLVHKHSSVNGSSAKENNAALEKLFDCLENMEDEGIISELISENSGKKEEGNFVVRGKHGKEVQMENTNNNNSIRKKSLSFILKKAILCRGGFTPPHPAPPLPLRERFPLDTKFEKSIMEKILRAILHKKIYPQASNTSRAATKKYLDSNMYLCENTDDSDDEDDAVGNKAIEGSKWVKTDSDFIVLEI